MVDTVTDDDRTVRRVSDATRARIDELADGWAIDIPARPKDPAPVVESAEEAAEPSDPTHPAVERAVDKAATEANSPDRGEMLPRTRGIVGDIRYVATVLFGIRATTRQLQAAEAKQLLRQASRQHHLTTVARQAASTDGIDHPAILQAREALRRPEEKRLKHAAGVAAANAELDRIRRERKAASEACAAEVAAAEAALAERTKQLEPLVLQAATSRRRAADLDEQVRVIGKQIARAEQRLVAGNPKTDPVAVQAEIAALKADQQAIERDQPKIAAEIEALRPQIASLRLAIRAARKQQSDARAQETAASVRATEQLEAAGARRKVDERGIADAEIERDKILLELGQRLHVDHPAALSAQLGPIDQIDREIDEGERRIAELHDILSSIDRPKIIRGGIAIALATAAAGAALWLLVG